MRMDRRQFLTTTIAGAGAMMLSQQAPAADQAGSNDPFQLVPLNKTGIKVSLIGLGTGMRGGMRQSNHTRMGKDKFEALVKHAWDRGVRLFDLADMYGTHTYFAEAAKGFPREKYAITTKIWVRPGALPERERPDADILLDRFRKELKTDYIDLVLIHCMTDIKWQDQQKRYMDKLAELKEKKVIRAHGVSIHSLEALKTCATSPWVDSVHARINAFGVAMDDKPEAVAPVLKDIHAAGKGVVGMKLIGEGKFQDDLRKNESIKYVLGLGAVDTMIVGCETPEQIDDFAKRVEEQLKARAKTV